MAHIIASASMKLSASGTGNRVGDNESGVRGGVVLLARETMADGASDADADSGHVSALVEAPGRTQAETV